MAEDEKWYSHRFAEVVQALSTQPSVSFGQPGARKTFGHVALTVNEKIFAMVSSKGDFVVKLPQARVTELIAASVGKRFEVGKRSPMKEWLAVDATSNHDWVALAREALDFVRVVP